MAHSGSLTIRSASPVTGAAGRRISRKNIFTRMIEALHFSRRLETARVLRRNSHLIADDPQDQPNNIFTGLR
jgi:hypothetical protein